MSGLTGDEFDAAHANIGRFFAEYAKIEEAVNSAFLKALRLTDHPSSEALTKMVDFGRRVTFLQGYSAAAKAKNDVVFSETWLKEAQAMAADVQHLKELRNAFAHRRITIGTDGFVSLDGKPIKRGGNDFDKERFRRTSEMIDDTVAKLREFEERLAATLARPDQIGFFSDYSFVGDAFLTD